MLTRRNWSVIPMSTRHSFVEPGDHAEFGVDRGVLGLPRLGSRIVPRLPVRANYSSSLTSAGSDVLSRSDDPAERPVEHEQDDDDQSDDQGRHDVDPGDCQRTDRDRAHGHP